MKCVNCTGTGCAECNYTGEATEEQKKRLEELAFEAVRKMVDAARKEAEQKICLYHGRYTGDKCPECK